MLRSHILASAISFALVGCNAQSVARDGREPTFIRAQAASTWARRLNPSGEVPREGFKAVYFDRSNLDRSPVTDTVDSIAIQYAWSELHDIDSRNFGGYWVGRLNFREPTTRKISVSQSWAKTRILIDGRIVFDSGSSDAFIHQFSRGSHLIEVEHINNWHTTGLKVSIGEETTVLTLKEISSQLRGHAPHDAQLYYAGIYESRSSDASVRLSVPRTGKPAVLWLASYSAVDWHVAAGDPVEAVIVSSYEPGSRITGVAPGKVWYTREGPRQHSTTQRCDCSGGGFFHCEDKGDLDDVAKILDQTTGLALKGYAMTYAAADISIVPFDSSARQGLLEERTRVDAARRSCSAHTNPDFDTMFK